MARMACPEEAHATLHVVQRGCGRRPCFSCAKDRAAYLAELRRCSERQACAVHAYALMGNHVHLLFTSERGRGPARRMPH
jgi:putative transposase